MDVHKPKLFHSWRELLREFGIIVLGVLTALAARVSVSSAVCQPMGPVPAAYDHAPLERLTLDTPLPRAAR